MVFYVGLVVEKKKIVLNETMHKVNINEELHIVITAYL